MSITWFRRPGADHPGTLNLCYQALDRHVIAGRADEVALRTAAGERTVADLLEAVATLAGALRALGVAPGTEVAVAVDPDTDPQDAVVAALACSRLGAVQGPPALVPDAPILLAGDPTQHAAGTHVLRRSEGSGAADVVDWALAEKAGREEPAGCADVAADAVALVTEAGPVSALAVLDHPGDVGRVHAMLAAGEVLDLTGGDS